MREKHAKRNDEKGTKGTTSAWVQNLPWRACVLIISLMLLCVLTAIIIAQMTSQRSVKSSGTVEVVGVSLYWDSACTNNVTSIDWGIINPGTSVDRFVFVKNDGTAAGTLSMSYGNFTPASAASYFTLVWNCSNYVLPRNAVIAAKFTLTVQSNITGVLDFGFVIVVQASA